MRTFCFFLVFFLVFPQSFASIFQSYEEYLSEESKYKIERIMNLGDKVCELTPQEIPTIFLPGILASRYSAEGLRESEVKRWIPDPITHSYDTLFYTFQQRGYTIKDVFYEDEYTLSIDTSDPKESLYLFGYDWKKDNKITATLLDQLIGRILDQYEAIHDCELRDINIIGHSMGGLVARTMLSDMCVSEKHMRLYQSYGLPRGSFLPLKSEACKNKYRMKVENLVTISIPHRGAPEILCHDENLKQEHGLKDLEEIENFTYKNIGKDPLRVFTNVELFACSHSRMPIAAAIRVYEKISGEKILNQVESEQVPRYHRDLLLEYIGHVDYFDPELRKTIEGEYRVIKKGIKNNTKLNRLFELGYQTVLTKEEREADSKITKDENINQLTHVPLSFGGGMDMLKKLVRYEVLSPINVLVRDEQGRRIGIDPETGAIINEIPGARTSGNTNHSGEPEFFLIPTMGGSKHSIKTYGTGDGSYRIVVDTDVTGEEQREGKNEGEESFTISGYAKERVGEDYRVSVTQTGANFENVSDRLPPTLEVEESMLWTERDTLEIPYSVRGRSVGGARLGYRFEGLGEEDDGEVLSFIDFSESLRLDLPYVGKYHLELWLVDEAGREFENQEARKERVIERREKGSERQGGGMDKEGEESSEVLVGEDLRKREEKYRMGLEKVREKLQGYSQEKKRGIKKRIEEKIPAWRERVEGEERKKEVDYILSRVWEILGEE